MTPRTRSILQLHTGIFLMSAAATFGKLIPWHATTIIFWRMLLAGIVLGAIIAFQKASFRIQSKHDAISMAIQGILLAGHWCFFFASAKVSTVAISIITVSSQSIMVTLLEPFFSKEKLTHINILSACIAFIGIVLMAQTGSTEGNVLLGVLFGVLSALCMAFRILLSKEHVRTYSGNIVMFYQLITGAAVLTPVLFLFPITPTATDIGNMLLLATIATAFGHTLALGSLKHLSATMTTLGYMTVVVYGTIIAAFSLQEIPSWWVVAGGGIVVAAVVVQTVYQKEG